MPTLPGSARRARPRAPHRLLRAAGLAALLALPAGAGGAASLPELGAPPASSRFT